MCAGASKSHGAADAWSECSAGGMSTTDHNGQRIPVHSGCRPPGWPAGHGLNRREPRPDHLTPRRRLGRWCDVTPPPPGCIILRWPHTHTHTHIGQWWSVRAWGRQGGRAVARESRATRRRQRPSTEKFIISHRRRHRHKQTDRRTEKERKCRVDDTDWATTHRHYPVPRDQACERVKSIISHSSSWIAGDKHSQCIEPQNSFNSPEIVVENWSKSTFNGACLWR